MKGCISTGFVGNGNAAQLNASFGSFAVPSVASNSPLWVLKTWLVSAKMFDKNGSKSWLLYVLDNSDEVAFRADKADWKSVGV